MLKLTNITKYYGDNKALEDVSFNIKNGEIVGFLGPNGAGKTTMMNIVTGYISSTSGKVLINGFDILSEPENAKKNIGYLPDTPPLYQDMIVKEYLTFVCELKGIKKSEYEKSLDYVYNLTKIQHMKDRLIRNLSRGYKQRVGLAQALIGNPKLIILDEPTNGLDPKQIIEMRDVIKSLGKDHTIILSSHILSEVSVICDRIIILNEGKVIASDTPDQLSKSFDSDEKIEITIEAKKDDIEKALKENKNIKNFEYKGTYEKNAFNYDVFPKEGIDGRREIFNFCVNNRFILLYLKSYVYSLEEIFIEVTKTSDKKNSSQKIKEENKSNVKIKNVKTNRSKIGGKK